MAVAGTLEIDVVLNGKKARIGLNELKKRIGLIEKSTKTANKVFGKFAQIASFGYMGKMALDAAKVNHELGLMTDRMGVSFKSVTQMRNSFQGLGGDAKAFDRILSRIQSGISQGKLGEGNFIGAISTIISPRKQNGEYKNFEEIMSDVADWTALQSDKGVAYERLRSIFGEMDDHLFAELNKGGEEFIKSLHTKEGLSEADKENAEQVSKAVANLKTSITTSATKGINDYLSYFTPAINKMAEGLDFLGKNTSSLSGDLWAGLGIKSLSRSGQFLAEKFGIGSMTSLGLGPSMFLAEALRMGMEYIVAGFTGKQTREEKATEWALRKAGIKEGFFTSYWKKSFYEQKPWAVGLTKLLVGSEKYNQEMYGQGLKMTSSDDPVERMRGIYLMLKHSNGGPSSGSFYTLADKYNIPTTMKNNYGTKAFENGDPTDYFYNELPKYLGLDKANVYVDFDVENNWVDNGDGTATVETVGKAKGSNGIDYEKRILSTVTGQ